MKKFISAILFWFFLLPLFSYPSDTINLSNSRYYPAVLKAIQNASKSISVCMYYISYTSAKNSKVEQILSAMADAVKRGVKVEVVLDRGFEEGSAGDMSKKNIRAYSFLKKLGIPVYYDDVETLTHAKYFVIDEKIVIVGSFNLSENSLTSNREAGVQVDSKELAKEFLDEFSEIPKCSPEAIKGAIPIPREFLSNKDLAPKMTTRANETAFDFYLLCQKKSFEGKTSVIRFNSEEIERNFYSKKKVKDTLKRFWADRVCYFKEYPFLKRCEYDKADTLEVELYKINEASEDSLYLSELYWKDGWDRRLTQKAKFSFLYVLDKTDSGRMGLHFIQEKYDAVNEYGVGQEIFAYGTGELQRFNLIEKDINYRVGERNANGFILNDFYIYGDFEKDLAKLKAETDKELFDVVCGLVDRVDEVSDLKVYMRFVELGKKYGVKVLQKVLKLAKSKTNSMTPYRQFAYLEQTIINQAEGK